MWGTPRASRRIVAGALTGAAISPEVFGNGRTAYQYTASAASTIRTAMLALTIRTSRVSKHRFYSAE